MASIRLPRVSARFTRAPAIPVFVAYLALFVLAAPGHFESIDYAQSVAVAQQIVSHGVVWITGFPTTPGGGVVPGTGGHTYASHDIGLALLLTPFAAVARGASLTGGAATLLYTMLDAILSALTAAVFFVFARRLTGRTAPAMWATAVLAVCTLVFPYAHATFDAAATALLLLSSVCFSWLAGPGCRPRLLLASAALAGAAVLVRVDSSFMVAALTIWVIVRIARLPAGREKLRAVAAWFGPLVAAAVITGWYDFARFGSVLDNGHGHDPATRAVTPLWYGLGGNLISPGKGLLFFAPPLLIAAAGWPRLLRAQRGLGLSVLGGFVVYVLFVSRLSNWSGAEAWGPRFLVPYVPLLMLPVSLVLARWRQIALGGRAAIAVISVAGLAVQLGGVLTWEVPIDRMHGGVLQSVAFHKSEIYYAWVAVWRGLRGVQPFPSVLQGGVVTPPVPRFDLWWLGGLPGIHAHSAKTIAATVVLFLVLVASAVWMVQACLVDPRAARRPGLVMAD